MAKRRNPRTPPPPAEHRGPFILFLGIAGLFVWLLGPVAWSFGRGDLEDMADGRMQPGGKILTQIGVAFGLIGTLLLFGSLLVGIVAAFLFVFLGIDAEGVIPQGPR
ncbi:MAG: hypothetical protein WD294_13040 [Phycisphaeraceae bacterium]